MSWNRCQWATVAAHGAYPHITTLQPHHKPLHGVRTSPEVQQRRNQRSLPAHWPFMGHLSLEACVDQCILDFVACEPRVFRV